MNWSIERKLPLFVSGLLLAVVLGLLTIGYGEVRRAARLIASERLQRATAAWAVLFQRAGEQQRTATTALAADSGVITFLASGGRRGREQALAAMHRIAQDTSPNVAAELWDARGQLLLRSGRPTLAGEALEPAAPDSAVIGPLIQRDTVLYYQVAAGLRHQGQVIGRVQQVRRLNLTAQARSTLTGLAGGDVEVFLGNAAGDPWTDFTREIPAPPAAVRTSPILPPPPKDTLQKDTLATGLPQSGGTTALVRYERGEPRLGVAAPIHGTPWMVLAELPRRLVLAPALAYRQRMAAIATLVLLVGALGAWWGSRRMTSPLREITTAAEAIAAGDLKRRVQVGRQDEFGRLARSFNTMAAQVARSLQHSEAMLRGVTETAHDAIIAADTGGLIRFWNPGAERLFGYRTDEVLGQPLTMLMPERFHDAHRRGMRRYVETREARVVGRTVELAGRRKDGTEFPLELSLGAAPLEGGMSFTGVIRDITERKRTQEALQTTNAELESFSYSVSHDLRAPLRAIHGFARILLEDHHAQLDPEAQRLLGVIDQNTRRMGQLIDDLLAFSRLGRTEIATGRVDMNELARAVADEIRRADVGRNGSLEIQIDPLPMANGDRALLRQVMSNLLQNAAKFTRDKPSARIEVGSRPDDGQTVYSVKDNGAGFDGRYADKLFGVFQRLHSAEQFDGTGVGLAIVKRIVQRHGGRVWAEGKLDQGATFYFTLPS
jgi:PAS domain S-box-containing protein